MRYVVIMAGGSGTRLWPMSRKGMPKQLLKIIGGKSLLRIAFERVLAVVPASNILVCTGASYANAVAEDLPEMPADNILGEPVGRDSLNAVAWPAAVLALRDPDAVIAQVSADQIMKPERVFHQSLTTAFEIAENDARALVTLGVVPTSPQTGFGYLQRGKLLPGFPTACEVIEFKEKPDAATAEKYVASGQYWWNSGMFVWQATTLLRQIQQLLPDTYAQVRELAEHPDRLARIYPALLKTSVDYGVMEPVSRGRTDAHVVAVELPIDWYDVGSFASLAQHLRQDEHGNAIEGLAVTLDSNNNLLINTDADDTLIATVGLSDMVVVRTDQITMVCSIADSEKVKALVAKAVELTGDRFA